jgi:hypothetical protein
MIETRPLFELQLQVPQIADLGATPYGRRRVATVAGGRFDGERLRGTVAPAPGGDWMLLRADDVFELDVRITLQTDDGASILMSYRGLRHGPADVMAALGRGEIVDPSRYYFRIAPVFETAAPAYAWLNKIVAVGSGRRDPGGPVYRVEEVL